MKKLFVMVILLAGNVSAASYNGGDDFTEQTVSVGGGVQEDVPDFVKKFEQELLGKTMSLSTFEEFKQKIDAMSTWGEDETDSFVMMLNRVVPVFFKEVRESEMPDFFFGRQLELLNMVHEKSGLPRVELSQVLDVSAKENLPGVQTVFPDYRK